MKPKAKGLETLPFVTHLREFRAAKTISEPFVFCFKFLNRKHKKVSVYTHTHPLTGPGGIAFAQGSSTGGGRGPAWDGHSPALGGLSDVDGAQRGQQRGTSWPAKTCDWCHHASVSVIYVLASHSKLKTNTFSSS